MIKFNNFVLPADCMRKLMDKVKLMGYFGVTLQDIQGNNVFLSVPEFTTITKENEELKEPINFDTSDLTEYKKYMLDYLTIVYEYIFPNKNDAEEYREELKDKIRFYVKTRKDEIWNKELSNKTIKEIDKCLATILKEDDGYKEI